MRNYDGTTYLQGLGEVDGIKAENLKVGDFMVFNGGDSSEIIKIEATKSGKSLYVTTKWNDRGIEKEYTRTLRVNTIIVVKELNPTTEEIKKEIETFEKIENNQVSKSIDNTKENTLESLLMKTLNLETRKDPNNGRERKINLNLVCDLAYIRCQFKKYLSRNKDKINVIKAYYSWQDTYCITKELLNSSWEGLKEIERVIQILKKTIEDSKRGCQPVFAIKFE